MDVLFLVCCFLIPFENFFFAPSSGWAAIAPIGFFGYAVLNGRYIIKEVNRYYKLFLVLFFCVGASYFSYLFWDVHVNGLISTYFALILGVTFLISFSIYLYKHEGNLNMVIRVLIIAYCISILCGLVEYIALKLNITQLITLIEFLNKRDYMRVRRVQFTFTEPSFISMHLFGFLLPLYLYTRDKRIIRLICIFTGCALLFDSSQRFLIDVLAVAGIYGLSKVNYRKVKSWLAIFMAIAVLFTGFHYFYNTNYRFRHIVTNGIYSDGSLAVRIFRLEAVSYGILSSGWWNLIGFGYSNSYIALKKGFDFAYQLSDGIVSQSGEIMSVADSNFYDDNCGGMLLLRIWAENGIIVLLLFLRYLLGLNKAAKMDKSILLYIIYSYIQGDSLAFYPIWLYIALAVYAGSRYSKCHNAEKLSGAELSVQRGLADYKYVAKPAGFQTELKEQV